MSVATPAAPERVGIEQAARVLAAAQRDVERAARSLTEFFEPPSIAHQLERARRRLVDAPPRSSHDDKGAEWYLDNYYLIRRVARQVEEELPRGFVRHLPRLTGAATQKPRIEALATALVAECGALLDVGTLRRFVDAYQESSPLTIAELWALPTMLRGSVLHLLLHFLEGLSGGVGASVDGPRLEGVEPAVGIERAVRTLRVLDVLDWKAFFERTNRVEAILRRDPSAVYPRMDFATSDSYRKVVEALAWATGQTEESVATLAIALAAAAGADERRAHVGYYLVAAGRAELEARIGYRPIGLERVRRAVLRSPTTAYLAPLALFTLLPLAALGALLLLRGAAIAPTLIWLALAVIPFSSVVAALLHGVFARLLRPRTLPKLDFTKGLPEGALTLVVMPTLLGRDEDVRAMLRQIELHYLSNPDPALRFALLTDDVDSDDAPEPSAVQPLLERVAAGIEALNAKHASGGQRPFHLLHREQRWNAAEGRYIGWERKRGKLEELNRWLRDDETTSYSRYVGDRERLRGVRFVITLDSDTQLPLGSAHKLVGILAHPLNRAVFDEATGRVTAGYTVVQPRIDTSPSDARRTRFARLFAGDVGFDIYTHASSELYQDLFGSGIYVGKGIYDVDSFTRSLEGRAPENALVSHDLFEGIHGRAALATDVVLFESYPSNYATYAARMHRWIRGDWQLVPWLLPWVPGADGHALRNRRTVIDRWKIADNLRRSLVSPLMVALFVVGWLWLPSNHVAWALVIAAVLLGPTVPRLAHGGRRFAEDLGRSALALVFLAYEATLVVDAIVRVLVRTLITRRHLLQWTSAAHSASLHAARSPRALFWQTMFVSPAFALVLAIVVAWFRPTALAFAGPLLVMWFVAPEIARWLSTTFPSRSERVTDADRRRLRLLARRTWRFFDTFVGPSDQWLPIDNYQVEPREQTAHRTSPTNIGLMLVATLSAWDLGYIGPGELALRLRRAFESIGKMTHYQGHLLNWYDSQNLQPLLPHYVSTVDSGNFAGCLVALKQGCRSVVTTSAVRAAPWEGLRDSIELLAEVVAGVPKTSVTSVQTVIGRMLAVAEEARRSPTTAHDALRELCDSASAELDRELLAVLASGVRHDPELLHALRAAADRLRQQLLQMRREADSLLPFLGLRADADAVGIALPTDLRLDEIGPVASRLRRELAERQETLGAPAKASAKRLDEALATAARSASALVIELLDLAARADSELQGIQFKLLYDAERKLFHIGYDATVDQVDEHHYDLLASEARLASYLAIVKREVPESHWYALGRPMARVAGAPALLSWGGTMFEYLMPNLLMHSARGTLLAQTTERAVAAQIAHGEACGEPWGVSESAYARVDAAQTYQYRSFGVPGLGFKRGLEEDHVVAPYASLLALSLRPRAVLENLRVLEEKGMLGTYGLFEAIDFTAEHGTIVRSYMAHHQGMLLVALDNFLNDDVMVKRFHSDPMVETGEALLNELAPDRAPAEWPVVAAAKVEIEQAPLPRAPTPWVSEGTGRQAFVLGNGRLSSVLAASGGGGLVWRGLALTRWEADPSRDDDGDGLFLRDEDDGEVWFATASEGRTTYALHEITFHLRCQGISVHVAVAVAAADDVEIRHVTLHNETDRMRRLGVTSAARPVLLAANQAPSHPAFSSMFVCSERVAELDGLLFARRPQSKEEAPAVLVHRLVHEGPTVTFAGSESDRGEFFGRGRRARAPRVLASGSGALRGRVGAVLDPIMSLMARVTLGPNRSVTLAFVTTVARSRELALDLSRKYGSMHAVRWALRDAEQEGPRRLMRAKIEPDLLPQVQRLFSALRFVDPALRASVDVRAAAPPRQARLWSRGISGDDPIVLVRVTDADAPIVREVLAAQRYLRSLGQEFDLVLVDERPSGYATGGLGPLRSVLAECDALDLVDRHGGVFLVSADQVPANELQHLEACARVVLDSREVTLGASLARVLERPPKMPRFDAALALPATPSATPRASEPLRFGNGLGGFSEDGREYVIDVAPGHPTPAPWTNVLANAGFGCLVSESSFGMTWAENSGENRLTPWRNDAVFDTPSEAVYLRDEETAAVWSPTPLPAGLDERTRVRHGAGYTIYERESQGIVQELMVFVPPEGSLKVVRLRLRNLLPRHRRLTATYYAEWVLGRRRDVHMSHVASEFVRDHSCLLASTEWNAEFAGRVAFVAADRSAHGFTADRGEFLGTSGDYERPEALSRWGLSGRVDLGADPCAALQLHLELAPEETIEAHFLVGQSASRDEALALIERFRAPSAIEVAWKDLGRFWDGILGAVRIATPEPAMDLMLNRWLLYQALAARVFARTGFYQSSGAFGYRDQLQDVLALLHSAPELARAHILLAAAHQFELGDVLHWWHPPSGRGVRTRCSDDMAWLPFVTAEYVAATGDVGILDEAMPFLDAPPLEAAEHDRYAQYGSTAGASSLLEHCRRALERAVTVGEHELPLMGDGDWNDGMSRVGAEGRGESVWLGWFLSAAMDGFADLSSARGGTDAGTWRERADALRATTRDVGWDGSWYLRAFHDDGSKVGSSTSHECRIDSIVQSWAVLGDRAAPSARAKLAVDAAERELVRESDRLVLLFTPPFDGVTHDPGYVRAYPPGVRENGGQYTHAATWLGIAHARLGDGGRAARIFALLNPVLRTETAGDVARYRLEPYVVAGDVYGATPWSGRGGWSWYTGAAAWMWRLGVESILGLRRERGNLRVDPCIPPTWDRFEAWVRLGDESIHVVVENPEHVSRGIAKLTLDGVVVTSNVIEARRSASGTRELEVRLGRLGASAELLQLGTA